MNGSIFLFTAYMPLEEVCSNLFILYIKILYEIRT